MAELAAGDKDDGLRGIAATLLYVRDAYRHRLQHPLPCSFASPSHAQPVDAGLRVDTDDSRRSDSHHHTPFSPLEQTQLRWLVGGMALQLQAMYPAPPMPDNTAADDEGDEADKPTGLYCPPAASAHVAAVRRPTWQALPGRLLTQEQQHLRPSQSPFSTSAGPTLELPTSFERSYDAQSYLVPTSLDACYTLYRHRHEQPTAQLTEQPGNRSSAADKGGDVVAASTQMRCGRPHIRPSSHSARALSVDGAKSRLAHDDDGAIAAHLCAKRPCLSQHARAWQRIRRTASESALVRCTSRTRPGLAGAPAPSRARDGGWGDLCTTATFAMSRSACATPAESRRRPRTVSSGLSEMPSACPLSRRSSQQEMNVDSENVTGSSRHPSLLMRRPRRLHVLASHTQRLQSSSTLSLSGSLAALPTSSSSVAAPLPATPCERAVCDASSPTAPGHATKDDEADAVCTSAHKTPRAQERVARQCSPVTDSPERYKRELSGTRAPMNDMPDAPSEDKQCAVPAGPADTLQDIPNTADTVSSDGIATSIASAQDDGVIATQPQLVSSSTVRSAAHSASGSGSSSSSPRHDANTAPQDEQPAMHYAIDRNRLEAFVRRLQEVTSTDLSAQELAALDLRYAIPGICEVHGSDETSRVPYDAKAFVLPLVANGAERVVTLDDLPCFAQLVEDKVHAIMQLPCQDV